jgi:hypothetical protein
MDEKGKWGAPVSVCIVMLAMAAYVFCYLSLPSYTSRVQLISTGKLTGLVRQYPHDWQTTIFWPASRAESAVRWIEVEVKTAPPLDP